MKIGSFTCLQVGSKYVYFKAHQNGEVDKARTLFVVNHATLNLKALFEVFGDVSSVELGTTSDFPFAKVTFTSSKAVKKALAVNR